MEWQRLIRRLTRDGMTQREIAKRIGVSQGYVSKLASGTKDNPTARHADRLRRLAERAT